MTRRAGDFFQESGACFRLPTHHGERALHHVLELVPYQFVRPPSEYQGHFREAEVRAKFAKEYGFSKS